MTHIPVLLEDVLQYTNAATGGNFIDATVGAGGHAKALLQANPKTKILGLDRDNETLEELSIQIKKERLSKRVVLKHANYTQAAAISKEIGFEPVNGILIDLGFSSMQMDAADRGFSFQTSGPLDMRFDRSQELTAAKVINSYDESDLTKIFKEYGEEINSKKIARALVAHRTASDISTTDQVLDIVKGALPGPVRHKAADSARRIFQALRIEVNGELNALTQALPEMFEVLAPGGRLLVISFHSLEDRIVKNFFNEQARGCICPPEFPVCICGQNPKGKILTKKPIIAGAQEIAENSRSKPAKLRVIEKI